MHRTKAEIIAVGNEVLGGSVINTNSSFISQELEKIGLEVHRQQVVGDNENDIVDALSLAIRRSQVVIFCGGLGPTKDDMTKEIVAGALNLPLIEDAETLEAIKCNFDSRSAVMTENNRKQALVVAGAEILKNPNGTAPGIYLKSKSQIIALLPGPPNELRPMVVDQLCPKLIESTGRRYFNIDLRVFGIGESALEEKCADLLYGDNPTSALYANPGQVRIAIHAFADDSDTAKQLVEEKAAQYKELLGDLIYSDNGDSINENLVRLLINKNRTVSTAESCTGGLLSSRITDVPGSSQVFTYGITSYADWVKENKLKVEASLIKKYTAVSSVAAAEMAKSARRQGHSDYGVGITGIAGPGTGGYVDKPVGLAFIAVADKTNVVVKRFNFGSQRDRENIRELCVLNACDMTRRLVLQLPISDGIIYNHKTVADIDNKVKAKTLHSSKAFKGLAIVLAASVMVSASVFGARFLEIKLNANVNNEIKTLYLSANTAQEGLSTLLSRNEKTIGWITVGDAAIEGAVVSGGHEDFYRTHDFDGNPSKLGCLYTESSTDISKNEFGSNTVIYGSNIEPDKMFGSLSNFTEQTYLTENNIIKFETQTDSGLFRVVSVLYANISNNQGETQNFYRRTDFSNAASFQDFVAEMMMRSLYTGNIDVKYGDNLITLITDSNDWDGAQLVIIARHLRENEVANDPVEYKKNIAVLYPEVYYRIHGIDSVTNQTAERDKWLNWLVSNSVTTVAINEDTVSRENNDGNSMITVMMNGEKLTATPLEIISMMVSYEMGETYEEEALKAQAVACISRLRYMINKDPETVPSVEGRSEVAEVIRRAVSSVICTEMKYDGEPVKALSFQLCNGKTNNASEVLDEDYPYLRMVDSIYDTQDGSYLREVKYTDVELRQLLEIAYNVSLSDDTSKWITAENLTTAGYVKNVSIDGQAEDSGKGIIELLGLRSADFSFSEADGQFIFVSRGAGDGVGMSKSGANMYALYDDWTAEQILTHYYSGIKLVQFDWNDNTESTEE